MKSPKAIIPSPSRITPPIIADLGNFIVLIALLQIANSGIIVLGNEANGISKPIEKLVSQRIAIPRFGELQVTESLNVANATGILLSEFSLLMQEGDPDLSAIMMIYHGGYYTVDMHKMNILLLDKMDNCDMSIEEKDAIYEKYEGAVFVDFVPTSENLTAWILKIVQKKMRDLPGIEVLAVEYWETPKSHCRVEA